MPIVEPSEDAQDLKSLIGTSQARFLNQYNPLHDKPYEKPTLDSGSYVDKELAELLAEDRCSSEHQRNHKKKDWMKSYMDECVKFKSITKGGKQ